MRLTAWDHNRWYHRLLIREVPAGAERVLDVGCGAGTLVRRLAADVPHVEGLDRSPRMIEQAAKSAPPNVRLHLADALAADLPAGGYDAVLSSSFLHHVPLAQALPRMAGWLRPGGVLAAVALPRIDLPRELPVEVAAVAAHLGLGLTFSAVGALTGRRPFQHEDTHEEIPVTDAVRTVREVRREAAAVLPGARVRRLLLWRYLLTWTKP